nr:hypothetical protein [Escherichia coli]
MLNFWWCSAQGGQTDLSSGFMLSYPQTLCIKSLIFSS